MARRLFLTFAALLLFAVAFLPVLSMFVKSTMVDGHFSLVSYAEVMKSSHQWILMRNSMVLSCLVMVFSVAVGLPLGILLGKTDFPFRHFFMGVFVVPLLIPPYILAVSWSDLLGSGGLVGQVFGLNAAKATSQLLFGLPGTAFILFSIFLPIPMLLTMILLRTINPRLEEAARLVSGWNRVLRGVTIPLVLPGVLLSAVLVFLLSFGEFSVPNFLRFAVFPVESFTQFSAFYNFKAATAATSPLVIVTLVLLFAEARFLREKTYQLRPSPEVDSLAPVGLGSYRMLLFIVVAVLALVLVIVPLAVLLIQAGGSDIYLEALENSGGSLLRSIGFAVVGATLLALMGLVTGYLIQRRALWCWRAVDSMTLFVFALPSTVVGIGLISLWNTPETTFIYSTPLIIILGYVAKYTALTSRISVAQLGQISPSMEEAAQVAGAGWFHTMAVIVAPLAWRGLAASWLVGYIFCLRDMGITMLVYPPGHETLPVRIFTQMANGSPQLIAALCTVMIVVTLLPVGLFLLLFRLQNRRQRV